MTNDARTIYCQPSFKYFCFQDKKVHSITLFTCKRRTSRPQLAASIEDNQKKWESMLSSRK